MTWGRGGSVESKAEIVVENYSGSIRGNGRRGLSWYEQVELLAQAECLGLGVYLNVVVPFRSLWIAREAKITQRPGGIHPPI